MAEMEQCVQKVLEGYSDSQVNLASEAAREILSEEICAAVREEFPLYRVPPGITSLNDQSLPS